MTLFKWNTGGQHELIKSSIMAATVSKIQLCYEMTGATQEALQENLPALQRASKGGGEDNIYIKNKVKKSEYFLPNNRHSPELLSLT